MQVVQAMTRGVVTVDKAASISEAARVMRDRHVGCLVIVENDSVVGIITDRDIATRYAALEEHNANARADEYMSPDPVTIQPEMDVMDALQVMKERRVKRLPVIYAGKLRGIVALADIAATQEPATADLVKALYESRHNA